MEVADDNFFIEDPQKLANNFFNKNKSIQMVELLASKSRHSSPIVGRHMSPNNNNNNSTSNTNTGITTRSKRNLQQQQQQPAQPHKQTSYTPTICRLSYAKKAQLLHNKNAAAAAAAAASPLLLLPTPPHETNDSSPANSDTSASLLITPQAPDTLLKPTCFIDMLELLCMAAYKGDDISLAKRALDSIICASNSGCCFLEKYLVMLLNFCTRPQYRQSSAAAHANDPNAAAADEALLTIKMIDELSRRAMLVEFDRQQMTENLRRPDYKLNSVTQIVHLLELVQGLLDVREQKAIDWLSVILDAYFVELATSDEADPILDQICARIQFQCSLLREVESNKSLLKSIYEYQQQCCNQRPQGGNRIITASLNRYGHRRPYYSIETIEI